MDINWPTVLVSIVSSLVVTYVGVRFFTASKINAEHAAKARREMRSVVAPLLRDAGAFKDGRATRLKRDEATHVDDGMQALRVLELADDLPWLRRKLVERRSRIVFGLGWVRAARDVEMAPDKTLDRQASRMMAHVLFDQYSGPGMHVVGTGRPAVTFSDGLMQRGYQAGPSSPEARQLQKNLEMLQQAR